MKPFRNKGWRWLHKFESILPIAGARGRNSFVATSATAPPLHDGEGDLEGESEGPKGEEGSTSVGVDDIRSTGSLSGVMPSVADSGEGDQMDVDTGTVGLSELSIGKRKHSDSLSENNELESVNVSTTSLPSITMPPKKKVSSRGASSQSASKVFSKTSSPSGHISSSSKAAARITPAVAIHNMQGSINQHQQTLVGL
jgi:hypothetical protein